MAFTATTEWEVRTTGSDSNGGAFDTASTGTDYSQRDTPQVSYTDLVIGSTNTQLTSAANPFTAAHVGNIINVTGGTGFTVQRVQVVSVAGAVATCDKACGTASSTGGTGNLGGGLLGIQTAVNLAAANNRVHIKAGTYTFTTALTMPSGVTMQLIGYQTAHLDNTGTKPLLTTSTNSLYPMIKTQGSSYSLLFSNLEISNTAATPSSCFAQAAANWTVGVLEIDRCKIHGFAIVLDNQNGTYFVTYNYSCLNSEFYSCQCVASFGGGTSSSSMEFWGCYIHDMTIASATDVFGGSIGPQFITFDRCILTNSASGKYFVNGAGANANYTFRNTIFYKSGGSALAFGTGPTYPNQIRMENCVIYGSAAYAFDASAAIPSTTAMNPAFAAFSKNNAIGGNTSGRAHNTYFTGEGEITLTADPFTGGSTGNFSLNSVAGGGVLLKAAGFGNTLPGVTNSAGSLDIGAVQSAGAGGGGGGGSPVAMRPSPIIRPM